MSAIVLHELTKTYGGAPVIRGVTLTVQPGELFGFLGPNGAGKTTTIKILTGLLLPTSGQVRVAGFDVVADPFEVKRRVGYVPDRAFLYPKLTGAEFLDFVGHLYRLDRQEVRSASARLVERLDLEPWIDELVESYSEGMRQKLAMIAALLHRPQVIVLDEPMVGLDPRSARRVRSLLSDLARAGQAVFLSTHSLEVAEALCDRVAIIHRGRVVAQGSLDELRREALHDDGSLETIFLKLTEDPEAVDRGAGIP